MTLLHWTSFVGVWTLASVALGPNAVNCVFVSARHGAAKALWAVAGILAASVVYQTLVFLGVAAILAAAATAFTILKLAGCAYILYLGIRLYRGGVAVDDAAVTGHPAPLTLARDAFLIALSNPKTILAYAAIYAQFVVPGEPLAGQALVLVPTALTLTGLAYVFYALVGAPLRTVTASAARLRLVNRLTGSFFIASAAAIAANEFRR
jgi:threonine/homoserine/homoserine lactone efflux protein